MQTLYAIDLTDDTTEKKVAQGIKMLDAKIMRTLENFTLTVGYMVTVAQYATTDAANRSKKYLPTADDLNVNTKLAENEWILKITGNASFQIKLAEIEKRDALDKEWVKKLYQEFVQTEAFEKYTVEGFRHAEEEKNIAQKLSEFLLQHEKFTEFLSDEVNEWEEDKAQTEMLLENLFAAPHKVNFNVPLSKDKKEFAHELLTSVIEKDEVCMELIKPKLQNWDAERVAIIDLLLLRMGVSELLFFPTIPTKVTINEYIELAKLYSTQQSGQFINGVLDNIQKELHKEGRINKQERYHK